jgi:methanogenic corrinoid protein MtbC1
MIERLVKALYEAFLDTDRDRALRVVHDAVSDGVAPEEVVFKVIVPAMELMMKSVSESLDANLAQHFLTSQIAAEATEDMIAKFSKTPSATGHVVIGTAQGDLHSLGKRIVIGCLKSLLMDVTDLGVNVPPHRFVEAAIARNADVIGISAMMVHTARGENGCLGVRQILKHKGLEHKIKIAVGGAPYRHDHELYKVVQADAWAENGIMAGKVISDLVGEVKA